MNSTEEMSACRSRREDGSFDYLITFYCPHCNHLCQWVGVISREKIGECTRACPKCGEKVTVRVVSVYPVYPKLFKRFARKGTCVLK